MKFLVFSDVHIGGKFSEEMFLKGVDVINNTKADYYIFTGDLTDQGTVAEFELAKDKYLPLIKKKVLMIPGNHDVKNVGDLLWEEYIGPRYFQFNDKKNKTRILGLDSNEPDQNTGRMGEKAINRIYEEFQDLDDEWLKVLVFHHQTLPIRYTGRERSALIDAGDTIKAIMDCNIDLVLNGHRHISNVYRLTDGDINTLVVNCGTMSCKKTRHHEQFSLTMVEIDKNQTMSKVDILKLNPNKLEWENKFDGNIEYINMPTNAELGKKLGTIIQIGNTDFSKGGYNLSNFLKGVNMINSIECDLVIHTGDITKSSYKDEFEKARALLHQIHQPLILVPGPRDYFPLGYELYPTYFGTPDPVFESENLKVMGINSCILGERIGRLGRTNCDNIIKDIVNNDKLGVIAFHHTIIPLPRSKHESELQDAGDVLSLLVNNKVDLVLTGAKNRSGSWQVDDSVFVNSGTLSSYNIVTAKGNSFNIIQIYETGQGKYFKVDEYFIETGETKNIGRFHIKS